MKIKLSFFYYSSIHSSSFCDSQNGEEIEEKESTYSKGSWGDNKEEPNEKEND